MRGRPAATPSKARGGHLPAMRRQARPVSKIFLPTSAHFVERWTRQHGWRCRTAAARKKVSSEARGPVEQLLRLVVDGFRGTRRSWARTPFEDRAKQFFDYLVECYRASLLTSFEAA